MEVVSIVYSLARGWFRGASFIFKQILLGRTPYVVERFVLPRVYRQFGRVQPMPQGMTMHTRVHKERTDWGPTLDFAIAWAEFYSLPFYVWNMF